MDRGESAEREEHLEAVWTDGIFALRHVPERYRADPEIVLAAVQRNGLQLQYAADECKADRQIVLAA
eukprot:723843-Amphidinium_carterae.1